jgi:hypothetical protein
MVEMAVQEVVQPLLLQQDWVVSLQQDKVTMVVGTQAMQVLVVVVVMALLVLTAVAVVLMVGLEATQSQILQASAIG